MSELTDKIDDLTKKDISIFLAGSSADQKELLKINSELFSKIWQAGALSAITLPTRVKL